MQSPISMKVLVTGANGLLGSHVVRELLRRGYEVRVIVRRQSNMAALENHDVEYFYGNLTVKEDINNAVKGCTHVIHSAARAVHSPSHLEAYREVNIDSTRYITDACRKEGITRLIYVSTANCIGYGTKENPGTEVKPFISWFRDSGYAYSKYLAQQYVLDEVNSGALDAVVVNPTFILGDFPVVAGPAKIFSFILFRKFAFYPPGGKNFVDADAAATAIVNALERGRKGECYLLAGENLSYFEFLSLVSSEANHKVKLIPIPAFLLKLAGRLGSLAEKIFGFEVALTYVNARLLCVENYYSPAKAADEIGLPVISAREAIQKSLPAFFKLKGRKNL